MDEAFIDAASTGSVTASTPPSATTEPTSRDDKKGGGSTSAADTLPPSVLESWASFDLTSRRKTLDEQGLEIADRQEASSSSRKRLATLTRTYKKDHAGASTSKATGALLREYQSEIDALTTRSKCAESAFLVLYRALYDVPDPVGELRAAVAERAAAAELRDERAASVERGATAARYEARIAELERAAARASERAADDVRAAVDAKQSQWMSAQHKAIEAYELREQELLHQIALGNDAARSLKARADHAQQQLNDARSALEDVRTTRLTESDMVLDDLEKARAESKALRRRCIELEAAGEKDGEGGKNGEESAIGRSALSAELAARDVEVSQLKDQVSALEGVLGGKDAQKSDEFAKLTKTIREKDVEIVQLCNTLAKLPSVDKYDNMKRQFETLRAFQLNEDENESMDAAAVADGGVEGGAESLEKRLLGKVKVLEGKLTRLRMELVERDGRIQTLITSASSLEEQVADQKSLITRLEDGINAMTGDPGSARKLPKGEHNGASVSETSGEDTSAWDWGEQREAAGLQRIMKEEDPSMLDIVAGQRDRFRSRTMELETENRKLIERVEKLNADLDALKSDNVRLYGKIRFVQSYQQTGGATSSALVAAEAGSAGPIEDDSSSSFLGKYRVMYEDMSNPYTLFNRRERHKRMSEMSAPERLTMRAGQRALSSKTSRLIAFFYVLALHFLVVLVLSTASVHSSCDSVTTKAEHLSKNL